MKFLLTNPWEILTLQQTYCYMITQSRLGRCCIGWTSMRDDYRFRYRRNGLYSVPSVKNLLRRHRCELAPGTSVDAAESLANAIRTVLHSQWQPDSSSSNLLSWPLSSPQGGVLYAAATKLSLRNNIRLANEIRFCHWTYWRQCFKTRIMLCSAQLKHETLVMLPNYCFLVQNSLSPAKTLTAWLSVDGTEKAGAAHVKRSPTL